MANGGSPKPVIAGVLHGLAQGQQIQGQLATQQEELKLKKQELDLKRKQIEFQTRQTDPLALFRAAMEAMRGGDPSALGGATASGGPPLVGPPLAAPQPGLEGGFAVQTPTMPAAPSPPTRAQPGLRIEPSITVDEKGGVSVTLRGQQKKFSLNTSTIQNPDGTVSIVGSVFDPDTGQVVQQVPIGQAVQPRDFMVAAQIAETFGAPRGSAFHGAVVGQITTALQLPDAQKSQALAQIEADVKQHRQPKAPVAPQSGFGQPSTLGQPPVGGLVSGAIAGVEEQQARKLQREEEIKLRMQPLSATMQDKVRALVETENLGHELKQSFRPEFVGKGFQAFRSGIKANMEKLEGNPSAQTWNYVPGGLAGGLRQFFGNISPEEVKFRRTIADISDLILRFRSGAQINEQEYQRLKKTLFELLDEPQVFLPSLDRFMSTVGRQIESVLETASTPASQLLRRRQQQPGAGTPGAAVPGGGPRKGQTLRFNPQTGRIE